jgi:hypothetical protein
VLSLGSGQAGSSFGKEGVVVEREELDAAMDWALVSWCLRRCDGATVRRSTYEIQTRSQTRGSGLRQLAMGRAKTWACRAHRG